jgi:hypothetical protein
MIRIACCATALLLLYACGGSKSAAKGQYSEECAATTDCSAELKCINGICTITCTGLTQCQALSSIAICSSGACYNTCHDKTSCPNGLDCVQDPFASQYTCKPLLQK